MHIGHKSTGCRSLACHLPHGNIAVLQQRVKINMLFLVCRVSECVRNRKSTRASKRQSVRVCICVPNPGLCENVITCMSKRALVYVSKMAPVLS